MPFQRPTLEELAERTEAEVRSRLGIGPLLPRSYLLVLTRVFAGLSHGLYGAVAYGADQVIPATADADQLERHADFQGLDPVRRPASPAVGPVTFTGTSSTIVPAGSIVQRTDGQRYQTDADATLVNGTADADVTAIEPGSIGNTAATTVLTLGSPIAGVDDDATVGLEGLTQGQDEETDEQLRARLKSFMRAKPQGGSFADYVAWALEVPGVTRVFPLPGNSGLGTVDVTFTVDDDPLGPIPSQAQVDAVQARLTDETRRDSAPLGATVTTFAPLPALLSFTVQVVPDTAEVRNGVAASLEDLVRRDAEPGGTIFQTRMNEAISTSPGEENHVLISPAGDFVAPEGELPIFDGVIFQ